MIDLLIAILVAMSTDTVCDLGEPVEWYTWGHEHPDARTVATVESDSGDMWLYHDNATGEYVMFVFKDDISDTLAAGRGDVHGKCAREVTP